MFKPQKPVALSKESSLGILRYLITLTWVFKHELLGIFNLNLVKSKHEEEPAHRQLRFIQVILLEFLMF